MRIKFLWLFKVISLSTFISLSFADQAKADLVICNKSSTKAYIAVAYYKTDYWNSSGWTSVYRGECETVFLGNIKLNAPYLYVADDNWNQWSVSRSTRNQSFCIRQSAFNIDDADQRCVDGMFPVTFQRITSTSYDKTINLY